MTIQPDISTGLTTEYLVWFQIEGRYACGNCGHISSTIDKAKKTF